MISWEDFQKVDIRAGTIIKAESFEGAHKPAYKLWIDFGPELGIKKTSAQITALYKLNELPGRQVVGIVNFPPKQIANFISDVLVTGFPDEHGRVILTVTDKRVPNGSKLF
ncbi:MAG: Protein secretion chaperonin CsaA [Cytophagales bacterium]|jgi:tRNA-binding protein|nr:tRNA-binding protein [Bacteroidota bacterium]MBS1979936.1 tRNA-binding protein [Bacteroidota bacterium]WHZ07318.1 MAG: Protein secretion chaperonin CsaA [Cytophagales bacterium]